MVFHQLNLRKRTFRNYRLSNEIWEVQDEDWDELVQSIKDLELDPKDLDVGVCDGVEVDCHITFQNRLVKFSISNPDFPKFEQFRKLLNDFTICDEYPLGVLETTDGA